MIPTGLRTGELGEWSGPAYGIQDTWKPDCITHCAEHRTKGVLRCENIIPVSGNQDHVFCLRAS